MLFIFGMFCASEVLFSLCSQRKVDEFFAVLPCALHAAGCYHQHCQAHRTGLKIEHFDFIDVWSLAAVDCVVSTFEIVF